MKGFPVSVRKYALLPVVLVLALVAIGAFALLAPARAVQALPAPPSPLTDWIIAVGITGTVSLVDTATDIVYPAVISGGLGSEGGGLFDVAVVPNSSLALISNFGDSAVYFVDFTDRMSPTIVTSVTLDFFAEDIVVTRDGRTALVTDGGFTPLIAAIDIPSRSLAYTVTLASGFANAVDVAPDGTVIVADYFGGSLHTLYPDGSGILTQTGSYSYALTLDGAVVLGGGPGVLAAAAGADTADLALSAATTSSADEASAQVSVLGVTAEVAYPPRPVNVAIAPDGQTVIQADVSVYSEVPTYTLYSLGIYKIVAPGVLSFTGAITNLARATQSMVFSADGTKVYLSQNGGVDQWEMPLPNALTVLDIVAPGEVRRAKENAVDYTRFASSQLFGVDTIALARGKAYLGNPTVSGASNDLRVVHLSDYSVKRLDMPGIITGVGVLSPIRVYLPLVSATD